MANPKSKQQVPARNMRAFDEARDELFQHIMRCGVIGSEPVDQAQWFDETMKYLGERFYELSSVELTELRVLGERFIQPPKTTPTVTEAVSAA